MRPARHHGGTPGSPVGPLLASGSLLRRYQEPPEVFALRAALVLVSLPAGKARLRLHMFLPCREMSLSCDGPRLDSDRSPTPIFRFKSVERSAATDLLDWMLPIRARVDALEVWRKHLELDSPAIRQENLHRPKARVRRSHRTSETYKPWPPEPGFARREAQLARWKLDHLGRLLKSMTNASACKEGVHGGTRGHPCRRAKRSPQTKEPAQSRLFRSQMRIKVLSA